MAESTRNDKKRKPDADLVHRLHARIKVLDKPSDEEKTKKTPQSQHPAHGFSIKDLDETADEKKTKQTPQALQPRHGPSMAPYAASELAHFSHERLVRYIADLQEQVTEETLQLWQPAQGLSMAPYTASELAHFSHERLAKYITALQEQVQTVKAETQVEEVGTVKTETIVEAVPSFSETSRELTEKTIGLPFFGDANLGIDLAQEKAFHLEVMQT